MILKGKKILLISTEKWGSNYVSKHQYALELAKFNEVYFLNPPTKAKPFKKIQFESKQVVTNLIVIDYSNHLPKMDSLSKIIQKNAYKKLAQGLHLFLQTEHFDLVWTFDPYRFWNLDCFRTDKKIYQVVDVHQAKYENELAKSVDRIFIVSEYLRQKFTKHQDKIIRISHGSTSETTGSPTTVKLEPTNLCKVALMGNLLSNNIDYECILNLCNQFEKKVHFYFIGPLENNNLGGESSNTNAQLIKTLIKKANVTFIGEVETPALDSILNQIDIHLICYKDFKLNIAPYKIMSYLKSGKVTLSSYLYDTDYFNESDLISVVSNKEFTAKLEEIMLHIDNWNSEELMSKRKATFEANSYENKLKTIQESL